jgi:peptidyl-dipeptidase A
LNARWWELVAHHQGLAPPTPRGEGLCDPAAEPPINDDPARSYDAAIGAVLMHQLHRHICHEILGQDVWSADYHGRSEVGLFLDSLMRVGATRDARQILREATGEDLSVAALLAYFAPLQAWLEERNAGRAVGFR